uniref:Right handed beta helix domain-containing protein n=1 Tax=viral metagenome TaxID=1070528 RepID=A0A6C0KIT5_9ZZZZ
MELSITNWNNYKNIGENWNDGSGNVRLDNDISINITDLEAANPLFQGFNKTFDFNSNTIDISNATLTDLSNALISDLSGGFLKGPLTLDVSGLELANSDNAILVGNKSATRFPWGDIGGVTANLSDSLFKSGKECGYIIPTNFSRDLLQDQSSNITNITVNNIQNTEINEPYSGGIMGAFIGYDSSGIINITNCVNNLKIKSIQAGGIIGRNCGEKQNHTGIITIQSCQNTGEIGHFCGGIAAQDFGADGDGSYNIIDCTNNGSFISTIAGGIIAFRCGYKLNSNGKIFITNCINNANMGHTECGGITSQQLGRNSNGKIYIDNCVNNGNIESGGTGGIIANKCGFEANGEINITNCNNTGSLITNSASLIYSIQDVDSATININNNSFSQSITNNNIGFIHTIDSNINTTDKNFNIYNNTITSAINNASNISSLINTIEDCSNIIFDICNNTINNTLTNASFCSGILYNTHNLQDCSLNCLNNNVTMNIFGTSASNAGIICIQDNIVSPTFSAINDCSLNISNNTITLNSTDNFNNSIFSVNSGLSEETPLYITNKTSSLILENNTVNGLNLCDYTYISNIYFPESFRPYIFVIDGKAGSNYWFLSITTDISDGFIITTLDPNIQIIENNNDILLKEIFKRSVGAIKEQSYFPVYELYNNKIIATKTLKIKPRVYVCNEE